MKFPFVIRKLKKILLNEEGLALRSDRFAPSRVIELKAAIEWLHKHEDVKEVIIQKIIEPRRAKIGLSELFKHKSPFK